MTTAIITTLLGAAPAQSFERDPSALPKAKFGKAKPFEAKHKKPADPARQAATKTRERASKKVTWPTGAAANVVVPTPAGTATRAAGLPVTIAPVIDPKGTKTGKARRAAAALKTEPGAPARADVRILDRAATAKLGVDGVVLTVRRSDGATSPSDLSVGLD